MANEVDINNLNLADEIVEVSGTTSVEDWQEVPVLSDGKHRGIVKLADEKSISVKRRANKETGARDGEVFLSVHIMCQDEDSKGTAFDYVNTMKFRDLSSLHVLMVCAGQALPNRASLAEIKELVELNLGSPQRVGFETEWEAQLKVGENDYRTVLKGMKNFPPVLDGSGVPSGKFSPEVWAVATMDANGKVTGVRRCQSDEPGAENVRAQARIKKYFQP